jgi:hypothetical protein
MLNFPKRTCWWLAVCLSLVAACATFLFVSFDLSRRGPFWDKYQQVRAGMTEKEVEEILGPPLGCDDMSFSRHCGWKKEQQRIGMVYLAGQHTPALGQWVVAQQEFEPQPWGETLREGWLRFRYGWSSWSRWLESQLGL